MTLHHFHYYSNFNSIAFYTGTRLHLFPPPNHHPRRRSSLPVPPHSRWALMASSGAHHQNKEKLLVIMGATGAGKSRLSLDLAARFPSFEIVNSDKMQLYSGLDITTNKLPVADRRGVPHHLLGELDPLAHAGCNFSPADFRALAGDVISDILSRKKVPMLVGGSNSFIHALLVDRFEPGSDVFGSDSDVSSVSSELRYDCCFLWVDVSLAVLTEYLWKRVDEMLDSGMLDELADFCDPDRESGPGPGRTGLRKAIGVPEFTEYFKKYRRRDDGGGGVGDDREQRGAYEEAVRAIKDNTFHLAKRQIGKILRLREGGWNLRRLEATDAFRAVVETTEDGGGERWSEIWERQVVEASVKIVKLFLEE